MLLKELINKKSISKRKFYKTKNERFLIILMSIAIIIKVKIYGSEY